MLETIAGANGGRRPSTKTRRLVDAVGLSCSLGYAALAFVARPPGEPDLVAFFSLMAWTGLPVFGLFLYCQRRDEAVPLDRLLFWAVAFRICGLVGGPLLEDDFYRYLWDGYRFATTGTPYAAVPEAFFTDPTVPAAFHAVLDGINHPELPTIYGPTTQFVFLLGYWLRPGSIAALQCLLSVVDLATVILLLRLAPARNVMLYAWCPLVVKEIAFTAHPDGLGVGLLLAALVLAQGRRWRSAAVYLGLACGAKIFALVLVPFVLVGATIRHWVVFGATLAALYAPFALGGGTDLYSLLVFAREWEFNAAAFGLLTTVLPAFEAKLGLGLVCALLGPSAVSSGRPGGPFRAATGTACCWRPRLVINPWYLLWVLPFAAIFTQRVGLDTPPIAVLKHHRTQCVTQLQPYQQPVGASAGIRTDWAGAGLARIWARPPYGSIGVDRVAERHENVGRGRIPAWTDALPRLMVRDRHIEPATDEFHLLFQFGEKRGENPGSPMSKLPRLMAR